MKKSEWEKRGFSPRKVGRSEPKVQWRKFRSYYGPMIQGTVLYELPPERRDHHVDRAFWLTAKVETGAKFGSVIAYDGTGMTAGLDQHIAVYPKELANEDYDAKDDQGGLWKLLRRLECVQGDASYRACLGQLWQALEVQGWYLAQDGVLRYAKDKGREPGVICDAGDIVYGFEIRDALTPVKGKVDGPFNRDRAAEWARMFHLVFSHPDGFRAQAEFGKEHLVERTRKRPLEWAYDGKEITSLIVGRNIGAAEDLAMCMYHCHSVNAPAVANKAIKRARTRDGQLDPKKLIRLLGNSSYGRWDDDIKTGRYQRTRSAARASGLWSWALFDGPHALMPRDLPG